ncbi:MAG: UDP-glucuronic acid decarboxylase family protein [bacterium]
MNIENKKILNQVQDDKSKESKKVLVTGGAGFLGSNLCRKLLELGHQVIAVDNLSTGRLDNIQDLTQNKNFNFIKHDIVDPIKQASRPKGDGSTSSPRAHLSKLPIDFKIDWIFNFACPASPPAYQSDPIQTIKTSFLGMLNMLELAKKNNARIMQASTSEVYGDPEEHPQKESYWGHVNPIGIRSCYDEGKRSAESLIFDYHRTYKTDIKVIRIFNTYGPGMDPMDGRVVSNFIIQALNNQPITMYGDGKQTRSFCYVDDLINGIIKMMLTDCKIIGPVNLGNPKEFTLLELAQKVLELTGSKSKIVFEPLPQDDPKRRRPDITLAKQLLNWNPEITLEIGLEKTIKYFDNLIKS